MTQRGPETMVDAEGNVRLVPGYSVTVHVPATSANLGPGFDALGLALGYGDKLQVHTVADLGAEVEIVGEGAEDLPRDARHLSVRTMRRAWEDLGVPQETMDAVGLRLVATNHVPHGRGQGSSAAAIVAAVFAAAALAGLDTRVERERLFRLAASYEGHPDNVAPAVFGGYTMSICEDITDANEPTRPGAETHQRMTGLDTHFSTAAAKVHPDVIPVVAVPSEKVATDVTRDLLPAVVDHAQASLNAGRAALLTFAITEDPSHLMRATRDWLHQGFRADAMPQTARVVQAARASGSAAVISGAGPTVLVLAQGDQEAQAAVNILEDVTSGDDWEVFMPGIDTRGVMVEVHRSAPRTGDAPSTDVGQ